MPDILTCFLHSCYAPVYMVNLLDIPQTVSCMTGCFFTTDIYC